MRTGGAERLVADMILEMKHLGHKVDIFLFDGTETPLLRELEKHISISFGAKGALQMWNPFHFFKLRKLIRSGNYDIVHSHNSPAQILTSLISKNPHTKFVTTEHNTLTNRRKFTFLRWIDPFFYKVYDHVVCVSKKTRNNLLENVAINPEKVTVITNGIDISKFSPDSNYTLSKPVPKINPGDKIILMVASFRKQKDHATLVHAMKYLPRNYRLWLAGGWIGKKKYEKLVDLLELNDRIEFLGERNDMPAVLRISDIVVLSTFYEGFGLSIVEGMAMGKPCIASDIVDLRDTVMGAGILFPPGDEEALAETIRQCVENKTIYSAISKKCVQRASQFDIRKTVNDHISLYQNLCQ